MLEKEQMKELNEMLEYSKYLRGKGD